LVVIESMKMEIAVVAPCDGEVIQLNCRIGGQVSAGQDLLVIQSEV
jgi:urea carboxylase